MEVEESGATGRKTIDEEKREEVFGAEAGDSFLRDVECAEDAS